jgi:hypothetical protein
MQRTRLLYRRTSGLMRTADDFIQHFNPACRVARALPHWPVSRLLLSLSDHDVSLRPYRASLLQEFGYFLVTGIGYLVVLPGMFGRTARMVLTSLLVQSILLGLYLLLTWTEYGYVAWILIAVFLSLFVLREYVVYRQERAMEEREERKVNDRIFEEVDEFMMMAGSTASYFDDGLEERDRDREKGKGRERENGSVISGSGLRPTSGLQTSSFALSTSLSVATNASASLKLKSFAESVKTREREREGESANKARYGPNSSILRMIDEEIDLGDHEEESDDEEEDSVSLSGSYREDGKVSEGRERDRKKGKGLMLGGGLEDDEEDGFPQFYPERERVFGGVVGGGGGSLVSEKSRRSMKERERERDGQGPRRFSAAASLSLSLDAATASVSARQQTNRAGMGSRVAIAPPSSSDDDAHTMNGRHNRPAHQSSLAPSLPLSAAAAATMGGASMRYQGPSMDQTLPSTASTFHLRARMGQQVLGSNSHSHSLAVPAAANTSVPAQSQSLSVPLNASTSASLPIVQGPPIAANNSRVIGEPLPSSSLSPSLAFYALDRDREGNAGRQTVDSAMLWDRMHAAASARESAPVSPSRALPSRAPPQPLSLSQSHTLSVATMAGQSDAQAHSTLRSRRRVSKSYLDVNYAATAKPATQLQTQTQIQRESHSNRERDWERERHLSTRRDKERETEREIGRGQEAEDTHSIVSELSLDHNLLSNTHSLKDRGRERETTGVKEEGVYQFRKYAGRRRKRERMMTAGHHNTSQSHSVSVSQSQIQRQTQRGVSSAPSLSLSQSQSQSARAGPGAPVAVSTAHYDEFDLDDVPLSLSPGRGGPGAHALAELQEHNQKVRQSHDMLHWRADMALPMVDIFSSASASAVPVSQFVSVPSALKPPATAAGVRGTTGGRETVNVSPSPDVRNRLRTQSDGILSNPMTFSQSVPVSMSVSPPPSMSAQRRMIGPGSILNYELFDDIAPSSSDVIHAAFRSQQQYPQRR